MCIDAHMHIRAHAYTRIHRIGHYNVSIYNNFFRLLQKNVLYKSRLILRETQDCDICLQIVIFEKFTIFS